LIAIWRSLPISRQTRIGAGDVKPVTLNYGVFLNNIMNFLIVAFSIFMVVKIMNRMHRKKPGPEAAPTTKQCKLCLSNIPVGATKCAYCTSNQ
jgi:large conductance mechanosensitive channel